MLDILISWLYTRRLYGPRCASFDDDCPGCLAWQDHDEFCLFLRDGRSGRRP